MTNSILTGYLTNTGAELSGELNVPKYIKKLYTPQFISFAYNENNNLDYELENIDTSKVTSMKAMFYENRNLKSLDFTKYPNFTTSNVINMVQMFWMCYATELNLSTFDTGKVIGMGSMFRNCAVKNLDISNFDTKNVTNIGFMFQYCSMTTFKGPKGGFPKAVQYQQIFQSCASIETLDVSDWDTRSCTSMSRIFGACYNLKNIDLSNWNIENCTEMYSIIEYDNLLTDGSLHSVLKMLLTGDKLQNKNLRAVTGISNNQFQKCEEFPEWQELVAKGWTSGF